MRERRATRVIPKSPVTVAIEAAVAERDFGVVANISGFGACVWSDGTFGVGAAIVLQLSFMQEPRPLQVAGRVVWSDPRRKPLEAVRYGLQWVHSAGPEHGRLTELIRRAC
jgi:hypothetical protein